VDLTIVSGEHVEFQPVIAELAWSTDPHLFEFLFRGDLSLWMRLCATEWSEERSLHSRRFTRLALQGDRIVGLLVGFPGPAMPELAAGCLARYQSHGEPFASHIRRAFDLMGWLFPPVPDWGFGVFNLAVDPGARGTGLGRQLLTMAEHLAVAQGCAEVHLDVESTNSAVGFYKRQGYEATVETRVPAIAGVSSHYRMVKKLGSPG
jgi:ribosomal protein S18 acetylase RimI-like enzyme